MTIDEIKQERARLQADMARREAERKKAETLAWCNREHSEPHIDVTPHTYQPVVTKSVPAPQHSAGGRELFTKDQLAVLEPAMAAVGEVLNKERQKTDETVRQVREELAAAFRSEIDKMAMRLRSEMLQDKLDQERQWRQADQQRSKGISNIDTLVSEMIDVTHTRQ